jgi:hypothetical protein
VIPLEFMVGRVVEVWADPDTNRPTSAMSRYSSAWDEYLQRNGIGRQEGLRLRPVRNGIYSVNFLIAEGRRDEAEQRLAQAGAVVGDLPELRARAVEWVAAYRRRVWHP